MSADESDLVRFMSDALIEVRSHRGWKPSNQDMEAFIVGLERTLVDQDRLVRLLHAYEPINPIPRPNRMVLKEDELDAIMKYGLRPLQQASVPRFLQTISDPLQLVLLHESIQDELTDYWWNVLKHQSSDPSESIWGEQHQKPGMLVPLDQFSGNIRVVQRVAPETGEDDSQNLSINRSELVFETAISVDSSGSVHLAVDWIDPIPAYDNIVRFTVYDGHRRQVGHGEGRATETLTISLATQEVDFTNGLYVDGEYITAPQASVRFIHRLTNHPQTGGQRDGP